MRPLDAAKRLGMEIRGDKIACPVGHRKGVVWAKTDSRQYKCHDCGAFGDALDLVRLSLGYSYTQAQQWLVEQGESLPEKAPKQGFPAPEWIAEGAAATRFLDELNDEKQLWEWGDARGMDWLRIRATRTRGGKANSIRNHPGCQKQDGETRWPFYKGAPGVWFPLWHPDFAKHPLAWRFRPLEPFAVKGQTIKVAAQRGPMARVCTLYRPGSETLIIAEGEPDWLVWCMRRPKATVIALTEGKWRPEWARFGRGCTQWDWVGHEHEGEEKLRAEIQDSAMAQGVPLHVKTVPESRDWADMWREL